MTVINIVSGMIYTRGMPLKSKIQLYGMALVFLVLLYGSPSGLVFYWTLNNVFSLIKNIVMSKSAKNRETKVAQETAKQETADPGRTSASRSKVIFYSCCVLLTVLLGILIPSAIVNASPVNSWKSRIFIPRFVMYSLPRCWLPERSSSGASFSTGFLPKRAETGSLWVPYSFRRRRL